MYDTIIIGSGPAGMTAAIYASRREMKALIIGKEPGGQLIWASEIENYPGFKSITNIELISRMQEQVKALGVETKNSEVKEIKKQADGTFVLSTEDGQFQTKTVIIAMGLAPRRLAIPGEESLTGRGVSYCANCDGPFYKGKTVVVVGGGNSALDAAEIMSKIASKVYLVHRSEQFKAFENIIDEVKARENIEIVLNSEVKEIQGQDRVEKVIIKNNKTNEEKEVLVNGVFVEVGRIAHTDLVKDLAQRNEFNQVMVNERCETCTPGVFAAGDVTQVPFKQITIACGQATIAALAAYQYLQAKGGGEAKIVLDRSAHKK